MGEILNKAQKPHSFTHRVIFRQLSVSIETHLPRTPREGKERGAQGPKGKATGERAGSHIWRERERETLYTQH